MRRSHGRRRRAIQFGQVSWVMQAPNAPMGKEAACLGEHAEAHDKIEGQDEERQVVRIAGQDAPVHDDGREAAAHRRRRDAHHALGKGGLHLRAPSCSS